MAGKAHRPYYLGCQGPSKGRCNATVARRFDRGADWCGAGCGYELCVQPGTSREALQAHLETFGARGARFLSEHTVNPF